MKWLLDWIKWCFMLQLGWKTLTATTRSWHYHCIHLRWLLTWIKSNWVSYPKKIFLFIIRMLTQESEHLTVYLRLPVVYCYFHSFSRGENVATDSSETYEKLLDSSLGLSNPLNVDYLLGKLGISGTQTPSLMRGLQR